jgi:hypothetical protein
MLPYAPSTLEQQEQIYSVKSPSLDHSDCAQDNDALEIDERLFMTPMHMPEMEYVQQQHQQHHHQQQQYILSKVVGDLRFPLLPVIWTGSFALSEHTLKQQLQRSLELKKSISESGGDANAQRKLRKLAKPGDDASDAKGIKFDEMLLRVMCTDDLDNVMEVENESFASPYERSSFKA